MNKEKTEDVIVHDYESRGLKLGGPIVIVSNEEIAAMEARRAKPIKEA